MLFCECASKKNDTIIVDCVNSYTNKRGIFSQDNISFFISKKNNTYVIVDSKGLLSVDNKMKSFAILIGAIKENSTYTDLQLAQINGVITNIYLSKYLECFRILNSGVNVLNWSWETSYSGNANGEVSIKNNLSFVVNEIKYKITYYDSNGNYMTEDSGTACNSLHPGEKYNFTFWSSHAKYPSTARVKLEFSDLMVEKVISNLDYSGTEFKEYIKNNK